MSVVTVILTHDMKIMKIVIFRKISYFVIFDIFFGKLSDLLERKVTQLKIQDVLKHMCYVCYANSLSW